MKNIAVLGSTGSIGQNTLDIVSEFSDRLKVIGLSAYNNIGLLRSQIKDYSPEYVAIREDKISALRKDINGRIKVCDTNSGLKNMIASKDIDLVVVAISGSSALESVLEAIRQRKTVALANKEALVMAGSIIMKEAKKYNTQIIPIDSEQSAIFQCLQDRNKKELKKIYLTASGGPLVDAPVSRLKNISVKEVLKHPRWKMGKKVTVDSATLINKGLELIEAMWLFDVKPEQIEILIHREAIVHSMVEFIDGSIIAQLGVTDMRLPIQYALTYPARWKGVLKSLDFKSLNLAFDKPDFDKFPCLGLAYKAARLRGTAPCVLNAANEIAVGAFLEEKIGYLDIYRIINSVLSRHKVLRNPGLNEIISVDKWARAQAQKLIN
ncbi:MAG: 1-deoxy-D-xylulose-5-phosphate reductoisomerase [Candidatus Omnitrophica bacterium]|nr:1-deoxy-D-xylulose-5-phosphate reductoisomerase [Candidatus Omnitrophota bacterium]